MATKKIRWRTKTGDILHPETQADNVIYGDRTVKEALDSIGAGGGTNSPNMVTATSNLSKNCLVLGDGSKGLVPTKYYIINGLYGLDDAIPTDSAIKNYVDGAVSEAGGSIWDDLTIHNLTVKLENTRSGEEYQIVFQLIGFSTDYFEPLTDRMATNPWLIGAFLAAETPLGSDKYLQCSGFELSNMYGGYRIPQLVQSGDGYVGISVYFSDGYAADFYFFGNDYMKATVLGDVVYPDRGGYNAPTNFVNLQTLIALDKEGLIDLKTAKVADFDTATISRLEKVMQANAEKAKI